MISILNLFYIIASSLAIISLSFPVITDIIARRKKIRFSGDLKLFELYNFFTLIMQILAVIFAKLLFTSNLILFRIYLPFHTAIFTYFLVKWRGNNNYLIWSVVFFFISIVGEFFLGKHGTPPNFMIWFDAIVLLVLSFNLNLYIDKKKLLLKKENNYIFTGIYLYSIITIIGISPSSTELRTYGFFFQSIAIIVSSYFYAGSFQCLFRSNG